MVPTFVTSSNKKRTFRNTWKTPKKLIRNEQVVSSNLAGGSYRTALHFEGPFLLGARGTLLGPGPRTKQPATPKGRPPGARNRKTLQWEELGKSITGTHAPEFNALLLVLSSSPDVADRVRAAELFLKVLDYFQPKLTRMDAALKDYTNTFQPSIINVIAVADEDEN